MAGQQRDVAETSPAQHAACGYRTRPVTAVDDEGIFDFGGNGRADDRPERDVDRAGDVACTELTPRAYVDDHGRRLRINQLEQPLRRDRWVTRHGMRVRRLPRSQRLDDFVVMRKTSGGVLRKYQLAVHRYVENAAVAAGQLGVDANFVLDCGCQTGSLGQVVSTFAIGNRHAHMWTSETDS
jgi:hypothetical protein